MSCRARPDCKVQRLHTLDMCRNLLHTLKIGVVDYRMGCGRIYRWNIWLEFHHAYSLARVHSMHLDPKISGMDLAFLSACRRGYSLNHTLWGTGVINCKSRRMVLLIFKPQMYASPQPYAPLLHFRPLEKH